MIMDHGMHFLWLLGILWVSVSGFECPYKECYCYRDSISCTLKGLNAVPPIVSTNTTGFTSLSLEYNNISIIPAGSLPSNLTEIYLDDNPVAAIDDSAFVESLNTLETISLWGAQLTKIPDALLHLKALKYFSIYDSSISDWNDDVMRNIGSTLENLELKKPGAIKIPSWLQYYSRLNKLTMESSFVSSVPENVFDKVTTSLYSVSFFNNSLTEVPKAISKLVNIKKLNLAYNRISNITWLPATNLTSLSLNNNQISDVELLSTKLHQYADSLKTLDLQVNQFTVFPDLGFFTNIRKLDLTFNRISDPDSGSVPLDMFWLDLGNNMLPVIPRLVSNLTYLTDLLLESNFIKEIKGSDFPPKVRWVYLGHNLITELNITCFPYNSTIKYLHLNDNPIYKVSDDAFDNLPQVNLINLAGTRITRLPLALASVSSLIVFDASNINGLVCTCEEKILGPRFLSQLEGDTHGNCGEISIYTFFDKFSSSCPNP